MFYNYWDKVKEHYISGKKEFLLMVAVSFLFSVILIFRDANDQIAADAIALYIISFIVVLFSVFFHDAAHRLVALKMDYIPKYSLSRKGLVTSLLVAFLSGGYIPIFVAESFSVTAHRVHRLGRFFYHEAINEEARVMLAGPIASMFLAGVARSISIALGSSPFFDVMANFNVYYSFWSVIPFPPGDGFKVVYFSRKVYVLFVGVLLAYAILISSGYPGIITAIFAGFILLFQLLWVFSDETFLRSYLKKR